MILLVLTLWTISSKPPCRDVIHVLSAFYYITIYNGSDSWLQCCISILPDTVRNHGGLGENNIHYVVKYQNYADGRKGAKQ